MKGTASHCECAMTLDEVCTALAVRKTVADQNMPLQISQGMHVTVPECIWLLPAVAKPLQAPRCTEGQITTLIAKSSAGKHLRGHIQDTSGAVLRTKQLFLRIMAFAMQSRIVAAMCPAAAARSVLQRSSMRSVSAFGLRAAPRATSRSGAQTRPGTSCRHQTQRTSPIMHGKDVIAQQIMSIIILLKRPCLRACSQPRGPCGYCRRYR